MNSNIVDTHQTVDMSDRGRTNMCYALVLAVLISVFLFSNGEYLLGVVYGLVSLYIKYLINDIDIKLEN